MYPQSPSPPPSRLSKPAHWAQALLAVLPTPGSESTKNGIRVRLAILPLAIAGLFSLGSVSNAQISIPDTNPVTENFTIGTTNTAALPANWKMSAAVAGTPTWSAAGNFTAINQAASSGAPVTGGRYNWGNGTTTTDRAIGFMTSSGYSSPNSVMANYVNNTGSTITSLAISFDIERYRINTAAANVTFFTSTDGSTWTAQTAGDTGAFSTGASAYDFTTGTVVNKTFDVTGLAIGSGAAIYLRWNFNTTGSNSQGLGLDNVSVTASTSGLPSPVISSFTPGTGWVGTVVTVTGTDFTDITAVKFNGTDATSFTVDSSTQITCTAPTGVTTGKITVTGANGTATSTANFNAVNPNLPTITSFTPQTGWVGDSVIITGTFFNGATSVTFNGVSAIFTVDDPFQITATVPGSPTTGKISVTTPEGSVLSASNFTAVDPNSLTLSASPSSFAENVTNPASVGTVTRLGSTASEIVVALSSSATAHATVPATVTIPAGSASATFDITAVPDNVPTANNVVTITASANGFSIGFNVTVINVDIAPATVVVNKYLNATVDIVELLVVGDQVPGHTVDMRGMILKDFSGNMADDNGGSYQFTTNGIWAAVPVGTLIVLPWDTTATDIVSSDFSLKVGLKNTTYFTGSGSFDISTTDMVMIKASGTAAGTAGGIHVLAAGNAGAQYTGFIGNKLRATGTTGTNFGVIANNSTSQLSDFSGTGATGNLAAASITFGAANNSTNGIYINQLRGISGDGYASWINSYFNGITDPNIIGFNADPDHDGVLNGVEALTGGIPNAPGVVAMTDLTQSGNTFTFLYPQAKPVPSGVTASYEWSSDLATWQAGGVSAGGITVTLDDGNGPWDDTGPLNIYQVTATVTAGSAQKIFVRVVAHR